ERECVCVSIGSSVAREKAMRESERDTPPIQLVGLWPPLYVGDIRNVIPEGKIEFRKGDSWITISRVQLHADIVVLGPKSARIMNPLSFRGYARS
ncbi:unnamed protein product, partial [Musa textilis]